MKDRYQYEITVYASPFHDSRGGVLAQRITDEPYALTPERLERRIEIMGGKIGGFERRVTIRLRSLGEWKSVERPQGVLRTGENG